MITLFNYWHFIVLFIIILIFAGGIWSSLRQGKKKLIVPMIISTTLISMLLAGFSIVVVDKYTKKVKLYKLKNRRNLMRENIMYSGIVRNEGDFTIGKVIFEIKLVNKGHATGNVKAGSFYKASGFFDFFINDNPHKFKPQQVIEEFVVAKNLKPGQAKEFRVYLPYPPYFRSTSQFSKLYAH